MIVMHGIFDLREHYVEAEFHHAFDAFASHLRDKELLVGWRMLRRAPHAGYDSDAPSALFHVAIEFADMPQADACYAYVEENREPLRTLHHAVNSKVHNAAFALYTDP